MEVGFWGMLWWVSGFLLTLTLFSVLIYKKRYQTIPWFTFMIGQDVLQSVVLFCIHRYPLVNFYTYYTFEVLDAGLRVLVIWEVARILVQRHLGLHLFDEMRSYWAGFVLMAVVIVSLLSLSSAASFPHLLRMVVVIGQVTTVGVGGLLLMVLWLTFFFRVKVRIHAQAVVYGLSLYLLGKVVVQGAEILLGFGVMPQAEALLKPVYHVSLILWIICLWREEPERALSNEMYSWVRQGRAGINPPVPQSVMEEQGVRRLIFSIRESRTVVKPVPGREAPLGDLLNEMSAE